MIWNTMEEVRPRAEYVEVKIRLPKEVVKALIRESLDSPFFAGATLGSIGEKFKRGRPDGLLLIANPYLNCSPIMSSATV